MTGAQVRFALLAVVGLPLLVAAAVADLVDEVEQVYRRLG